MGIKFQELLIGETIYNVFRCIFIIKFIYFEQMTDLIFNEFLNYFRNITIEKINIDLQENIKVEEQEENKENNEDEKWLICTICGNQITKKNQKIVINSSHQHTFTNPHGIIYTIRCFSSAPGCLTIGSPTLEYTWFSGYSWQVAICSNCKSHNGWKYSRNSSIFFGLITDMIKEE